MKIKSIKKVELAEPKQYYDVIEATPYNNFLIKTESSYIVSHNCNFSDEVNFGIGSNVEKQKAKLKKMISQIDARMISRFAKGTYLPTVNIIASSKDSEQAFMESYIEMKRQNESKTTLIVDEPQWVVRNDKGSPDDPGGFYVAVGNKFLAHELLPVGASEEMVDAYRAKGYSMLKVPPIYRESFEDNIDMALTDNAGISTSSSTKYISGIRLNQIKTDECKNPFTKDVIEVGNSPDDYTQYSNFFDLSQISSKDIARPLFIHLDMSLSGDKTGIAGTWITGKRPGMVGEESTGRELEFKAAFSVSVKAPKGYQVSFEKTRNFIRWLRDKGFAIKCISMDTYQSANMAQSLTSDGFKTQILSVDRVDTIGTENGRPARVCKPYAFFKSTIYERHLKLYRKCDLLTEEIANLERLSDGHVDHPKSGCFTGDTKVRLVDGRTLSFLELVEEYNNGKVNYVYSMNLETKQIEAKPILKAWLTLKNQPLLKVTLDNGEEIRCTANHRFMLRNGMYVEAQDLIPNDSLMPLYTKVADKGLVGYRLVYSPFEDKWHYEHRQFASEVFDEKYLVHHKNCDPLDNSPDNLIWMSRAAHMSEHYKLQTGAQSAEANAKRKKSIKAWHLQMKGTPEYAARNEKLRLANLTTGYNEKLAAERSAHKAKLEEYFGISWESLTPAEKNSYSQKFARIKDPTIASRIANKISEKHKNGTYTKAYSEIQKVNELKKQLKVLFPIVDAEKFIEFFGFDYYAIDTSTKAGASKKGVWVNRYRQKMYDVLNHKVVKVELLDYCEDVYDIEVADNHNFALNSGVFVHNSKDQADALCGSLYTASQFAEEYSYNYGENLEAALDVNVSENDDLRKQQMIAEFQEELAKIYSDFALADQQYTVKQKEEYQMYQDIANGIIIL